MREAGKGCTPRPFSVTIETYDNNFETIFGRKVRKATPEDELKLKEEFQNEQETTSSKSFNPISNDSKCSKSECGR
jgi:hypothetical protein